VDWRDLSYWDYLAMVSGVCTGIILLGEYVFHWWDQPGDVWGPVGAVLTLLLAGFGASRRDVRLLRREFKTEMSQLREEFRTDLQELRAELRAFREESARAQARQAELLEQLVASFRARA
jgi:hypothetical protein